MLTHLIQDTPITELAKVLDPLRWLNSKVKNIQKEKEKEKANKKNVYANSIVPGLHQHPKTIQ